MTRFMLCGGFAGFLVVFFSGLICQRELNDILRDAMVGCFVIAYLSKFFFRRLEICAVAILKKNEAAAQLEREQRKAEEQSE
jgi:hypothetical protein